MLNHDSDKLQSLISAFKSAEEKVHTVLLETKADNVQELKIKLDKKLDKVNIELIDKSTKWAKRDLPAAYKEGVKNIDGTAPRSLKVDETDVANGYIQLAQGVQHATNHAKDVVSQAIERAEKENPYGATVGGVTEIIKETLAEENDSMIITYNNGAKVPLKSYAEMLARTSRIMTSNTGAFDRCKQLGLDLVRCTTVPNCCPYCKTYEGKVYSISGNDKRFPALYETALQRGYNIMHPNCRHEFIPWDESFAGGKEELDKIIKDSNNIVEYSKDNKLFKLYNKDQAFKRQLIDESREFHRLQDTLGDKMPYKTLGGFRRARRDGKLEYKKLHYHDRDEKQFSTWENVENFRNLPKSLDKFQSIKYNSDSEYHQLMRERKTIKEINDKSWTLEFKSKAIDTYYELRKGDVEIASHCAARMLSRDVSVETVIDQSKKAFNYVDNDNGKKIKFYDNVALVYNKEGTEIVSVVKRKNTKGVWSEISD